MVKLTGIQFEFFNHCLELTLFSIELEELKQFKKLIKVKKSFPKSVSVYYVFIIRL